MVMALMMLELCKQWLWPLPVRSIARRNSSPRLPQAPHARLNRVVNHAEPELRLLAHIHVPYNSPRRR
jgi:hypothetical protein